ncbi:hypothetical protein T484DRAFT_1809786 [Baffinella frigidus]|nr:hypothetical protein T484DRAFT_1809786 [Cryptophyta sp. CCMP2293]
MSWDAAICVPQLALPGVGDVDERGGLQPGSPEAGVSSGQPSASRGPSRSWGVRETGRRDIDVQQEEGGKEREMTLR